MEYIFYIELADSAVPVMDIVDAGGLDAAREHARRMMGENPASTAATIYQGEILVGSLTRDPSASGRAAHGPNATPWRAAGIPRRR